MDHTQPIPLEEWLNRSEYTEHWLDKLAKQLNSAESFNATTGEFYIDLLFFILFLFFLFFLRTVRVEVGVKEKILAVCLMKTCSKRRNALSQSRIKMSFAPRRPSSPCKPLPMEIHMRPSKEVAVSKAISHINFVKKPG